MRSTFFILSFCLASLGFAQDKNISILIDPGHGGEDPGHLPVDDGIRDEKELALEIALKVGNYLTYNLSHVDVLYTRTEDVKVSLDERVDMANNKNVDYMMSIHINGSNNTSVTGTESHIHNYDSKVSHIWAKAIEKQFKSRAGRRSRGVKTAADLGHSLQILKYTKMPTILVECGFITNSTEANYLNSVYGQEIIASAIFRGTREFLQDQHPDIDFSPPKDEPIIEEAHWKVQIMASIDSLALDIPEFKKLEYGVERKFIETSSIYKYKYYVGPFTEKKKAKQAQKHVQEKGFPDAFLIYYE
ncbi:MAG: N-acetylmuramoyl-L-alanine amidase [Crocinitomicaceae bacterium]|nr:N-acetylmuramoyl-L-alanine amidase [Crocinitomicaceae bacterium]